MKTLRLTLIMLSFFSFLFTSCSKDSNNTLEVGEAKVTINGKGYSMKTGEIEYEKRADTTYFSITILTKDSLHKVNITFFNVLNVVTGKYNAVLNERLDSSSISLAYANLSPADSGLYWCDTKLHFGYVNISFIDNYNIECSFEFDASEVEDSSKIAKVKGSLSASFLGYDPKKIKDVPVHKGAMVVDLEGTPTELVAQCGTVNFGLVKKTIISGNFSKTGQSIVIECTDFTPKIKGEYKVGSIEENGFLKMSYSKDEKNVFMADGFNETTGTLKIEKITPYSIQGYFEFVGYRTDDPTKILAIKNGVFYALIKNFE